MLILSEYHSCKSLCLTTHGRKLSGNRVGLSGMPQGCFLQCTRYDLCSVIESGKHSLSVQLCCGYVSLLISECVYEVTRPHFSITSDLSLLCFLCEKCLSLLFVRCILFCVSVAEMYDLPL